MPKQKKLFDIREWIPYQLWRLSEEAGYVLEDNYSLKYNITGDSWRFMAMLACSAPISAKILGEHLGMDQVQVTRALSKLIENNYISRRTDPKDRRKVILNLSKRGVEVYQEIVMMAKDLEQKLMEDLSSEEQEKFRGILNRLLVSVATLRS
ncbi:MAG: MarR family transcriptional regulator [Emcibacter sp.]|nr:MarR family transcriptional regulator [Emcibacter sp.]